MFAVCQDMRGATEADYDKVAAELGGADERAEGLVAHVAGPVEGGFRIIDTWTSRERGGGVLDRAPRPGGRAGARGTRPGDAASRVRVARGRQLTLSPAVGVRRRASWPRPTTPSPTQVHAPRRRPRAAEQRGAGQERRSHDHPGRPLPDGDHADVGHPGGGRPGPQVLLQQHQRAAEGARPATAPRRRAAPRGTAGRPPGRRPSRAPPPVPRPGRSARRPRRRRCRAGRPAPPGPPPAAATSRRPAPARSPQR